MADNRKMIAAGVVFVGVLLVMTACAGAKTSFKFHPALGICGVAEELYEAENPMQELCEKLQLPVLEQIPFDRDIAAQNAAGNIVYETNEKAKEIFDRLYAKISEVMK